MNPEAGIRVWRCHIIAGCWERERVQPSVHCPQLIPGIYIWWNCSWSSATPKNLPMKFIRLDMSVSDKCTPFTSSVSLSWEALWEQNNRRGQRLFIRAWKVGRFTQVLLSIWLSTVEGKKIAAMPKQPNRRHSLSHSIAPITTHPVWWEAPHSTPGVSITSVFTSWLV